MKKSISFKTKGMNRDLSVSAFNPDFSFENKNLRLSTNEGNTMMSWVNERGTKEMPLEIDLAPWNDNGGKSAVIQGIPIGTAVIDHQLVLFTTTSSISQLSKPDYIYVLEYTDSTQERMKGKVLYNGNLGFDTEHPIETLVYYESQNVEKVYWTDGYNQPRLVNIKADNDKLEKWNSTADSSIADTYFDFVPSIGTKETFTVTKNPSGGGLFAPGVIQYCFTYINKYGQQSNIVGVSPLYYLVHEDRGASPEDKVNSSFTIKIENVDKGYDYIRLYSIQRTSLDADAVVKLLDDIPIKGITASKLFAKTIKYMDDPTGHTLPIDAEGYIETVTVENGSYDVTVTPIDGTEGFANTADMKIIAYGNDVADDAQADLMTLQELVEKMRFNELPHTNNSYFVKDYHAGFEVTQELTDYLDNLAQDAEYDRWAFKVGDTIYTGDEKTGFYQDYFIYSFKDEKWYISATDATETVTKQEVKGTDYAMYTDTGTTGSSMDPTELLYVGGREISAYTMADKDNTLFLGNITEKNIYTGDIQEYYDSIRNDKTHTVNYTIGLFKTLGLDHAFGVYSHTNTLRERNQQQITTFKGGETYRFGFQLQKKTGEWLDPIWIEDRENDFYPQSVLISNDVASTRMYTDSVRLPYAAGTINLKELRSRITDFDKLFRSIRPVIVFPNIGDRTVLCQGVLNPTVFNAEDRMTNSPFAQASWYFRPYMWDKASDIGTTDTFDIGKFVTTNTYHDQTKPDLSVSSDFEGHLQYAYVLVATISDNNTLNNILSRGYLTLQHTEYGTLTTDTSSRSYGSTQSENQEKYFLGAICLDSSTKTYAFLSYNKWPDETDETVSYSTTNGTYNGILINKYGDGIKDVVVADTSFLLYEELQITSNNLFFYDKTSGSVSAGSYVFKFYAGTDYYVVTFYDVSSDEDYKKVYGVDTTDEGGDGLRFTHYDSLYSNSDLPQTNTFTKTVNIRNDARKIEIQGSIQSYSSPFNAESSHKDSNTQFFIDQSIVTLNSPDIEFDTEVQRYTMDGLKLRVVGAIPITANVSSHSITTSSSMLEKKHNTGSASKADFGTGELPKNITYNNVSINAGNRLVADYLWNDVSVTDDASKDDKVTTSDNATNYLVYPWQRTGSLNNDTRSSDKASSLLKTKKEANLLYSLCTRYFKDGNSNLAYVDFDSIGVQIPLTENAEVMNYRLPRQKTTSSEINYYPNIDKVLVNGYGYDIINYDNSATMKNNYKVTSPVSMKYLSTSHAVIALNADDNNGSAIPILPYGSSEIDGKDTGKYTNDMSSTTTFWGDTGISFTQKSLDINDLLGSKYNFLWIGELYKDVSPSSRFGGNSEAALRSNNWLVGGDTVDLSDTNGNSLDNVYLRWMRGDTYYQRYDCLKTYPFTKDDPNQLVEILSFMCETHVNIDGRYDRNRGQTDNTNMSPVNFNLLNPVYSQMDNFFTYRKLDAENEDSLKYGNQIYYSKTKTSGADIDLYTNVTLASMLELDGDKGPVEAIRRLNDQLIAFQDTGISQILYNENVQISTTQGVPIEIANSGKVQGKRYLSDTIGCSNKWAMTTTPSGIYFMDNTDRSIYLFNGQLQNLSTSGGFNAWCKQNIPSASVKWTPEGFDNFMACYDKQNQDVLFVSKDTALAYSEKMNAFTSFYDYGGSPFLANLDGTGLWARHDKDGCKLWQHDKGNYCSFFGETRPYWMTLVGNPEPQTDKVFTNLEFRANVDGDGSYDEEKKAFTPTLPFDSLEAWDEYQHGITTLQHKDGHSSMVHHSSDNTSALKRRYRIWCCDIPRDNAILDKDRKDDATYNYSTDALLNVSRTSRRPLDRMRNPWVYLKLQKAAEESMGRTEIHDIMMAYFS